MTAPINNDNFPPNSALIVPLLKHIWGRWFLLLESKPDMPGFTKLLNPSHPYIFEEL